VLAGHGIQLEPLQPDHAEELGRAADDGELWRLWFTAVPRPAEAHDYIAKALEGASQGHMLPWVVRDAATRGVIGSTRYHDILTNVDRVSIGYTWYAERWQHSHVNAACKLLLLAHAFDHLGCEVVAFHTDRFNLRSQRALEGIGAQREGVLRHHFRRRDGSLRDSVMYSILRSEWSTVHTHLNWRLELHPPHKDPIRG
jgi:RimJ/RimL family protein N-acetyltransferase